MATTPLLPIDVDTPRYLPTYDETIVSYSLRLPTYRSSYIRRFHPYPRYITPTIEDYDADSFYHDSDEEPLDLSILVQRVDPPPENLEVPRNDIHTAMVDMTRELPEINEAQANNPNSDQDDNAEREEDEENLKVVGDIVRVGMLTPLESLHCS